MRLVTPELLLGSPQEHLLPPQHHPQKTEAHVVDGQELGPYYLLSLVEIGPRWVFGWGGQAASAGVGSSAHQDLDPPLPPTSQGPQAPGTPHGSTPPRAGVPLDSLSSLLCSRRLWGLERGGYALGKEVLGALDGGPASQRPVTPREGLCRGWGWRSRSWTLHMDLMRECLMLPGGACVGVCVHTHVWALHSA